MRTVVIVMALLPAFAGAQEVNPFRPGVSAPTATVFAPAPTTPSRVVIPSPLPPVERTAPSKAADRTVPPSVAKKASTPKSCEINVTPSAPLLEAKGGEFVLRVQEGARADGCIAGIESRESWLKIRYFNGRELALHAEPNNSASIRRGELLFANTANSLIIRVVQTAP
jgi:hypothetical protein